MTAGYHFSFDDLGVRRPLLAARARGSDLRPGLRSVGQAGVSQTRRRFIDSAGPDGTPWKPSRKAAGKTLIGKGLLLRSISARPATHSGVEWGSNRIYAGVHQYGGVIRAKTSKGLRFRVGANGGWVAKMEVTIPARPYLGVNDQNKAEFGEILLRHVGEPLTGGAA